MQWDITQQLKRMKYASYRNKVGHEIIILSEVSQAEKNKYHTIWLVCQNLKRYK